MLKMNLCRLLFIVFFFFFGKSKQAFGICSATIIILLLSTFTLRYKLGFRDLPLTYYYYYIYMAHNSIIIIYKRTVKLFCS